MPGDLHEMLVGLFKDSPELVIPLVRRIPAAAGQLGDASGATAIWSDMSVHRTAVPRADVVVQIDDPAKLVVIVEPQMQWDQDKLSMWPRYCCVAAYAHGVPVYLVVVTNLVSIARRIPTRLEFGAIAVEPLVIGPEEIPLVVEREVATAEPEWTLLSIWLHQKRFTKRTLKHRENQQQLQDTAGMLIDALVTLDPSLRTQYTDFCLGWLTEPLRAAVKERMQMENYRWISDVGKKGYSRGHKEGLRTGELRGEAKAVLTVLRARGLDVDAASEARILGCDDRQQLEAWLERAVSVSSVDELFG